MGHCSLQVKSLSLFSNTCHDNAVIDLGPVEFFETCLTLIFNFEIYQFGMKGL